MADFKRLTISLSFFATDQSSKSPNSTSNSKSPRNFEKSGIVGLGIVAAMNDLEVARHQAFFSAKSAILAVKSPRSNSSYSNPIPIISASAKSAAFKSREESDSDRDLMELSESYTCVIARIGNDLVKKCEYFDDGCVQYLTKNPIETSTTTGTTGDETANARLVSGEVLNSSFRTADFLNSCFLCKKKLHGLDIFMYRGEKGFCSAECRSKHIASEDHQEKCGSGAMKSMDYSVSPCSSPMLFFAGVAVA